MSESQLKSMLQSLNQQVVEDLGSIRSAFKHAPTKGEGTQNVWINLFRQYIPKRYKVKTAFIVDSKGLTSEQMDIVIYDRQYTPFIFNLADQTYIPAESVYAILEVKQRIDKNKIEYSQKKIESARKLVRTSLPVPYVEGKYKPKNLQPIIGGVLAYESGWNPAMGAALNDALSLNMALGRIDIGCIAQNGIFKYQDKLSTYDFINHEKAVTLFLFTFVSYLQQSATVPMIDIMEYIKWL